MKKHYFKKSLAVGIFYLFILVSIPMVSSNQNNYPFVEPNGWLNEPPTAPVINGPTNGQVGIEYDWTFFSTDTEGQDITYYVDWGDECGGGKYHGPYPSGQAITLSYTYQTKDTYIINSDAIDSEGAVSPRSSLEVTMPRNKIQQNLFIQKLFDRFPNAFPILRYILRL